MCCMVRKIEKKCFHYRTFRIGVLENGWIIKMRLADASGISGLMSADDYRAEIGE